MLQQDRPDQGSRTMYNAPKHSVAVKDYKHLSGVLFLGWGAVGECHRDEDFQKESLMSRPAEGEGGGENVTD